MHTESWYVLLSSNGQLLLEHVEERHTCPGLHKKTVQIIAHFLFFVIMFQCCIIVISEVFAGWDMDVVHLGQSPHTFEVSLHR